MVEVLILAPIELTCVVRREGSPFFLFRARGASLSFLRVIEFHFLAWSTYGHLRFLWLVRTHLGALRPRSEISGLLLRLFLQIVLFKHSIDHGSIFWGAITQLILGLRQFRALIIFY